LRSTPKNITNNSKEVKMIWLYVFGLVSFGVAYILDAVMDTVLFHRHIMIFPATNYWRLATDYQKLPWYRKIFGRDAWHDAKKLKQLFIVTSIVLFCKSGMPVYLWLPALPVEILIFHELFFKYIFIKKGAPK